MSEPAVPAARAAVAGALAAVSSLAAAELLAGLFASVPSLVTAVGSLVIDLAPAPVKEFTIAVFGTADKPALIAGIVVVASLIGAVVGRAGSRRPALPPVVFSAFALLGVIAGLRDPQAEAAPTAVAAVVAAAVGLAVLSTLLRTALAVGRAVPTGGPDDPARRRFLLASGAMLALAALAAVGGRRLLQRTRTLAARRSDVVLPAAVDRVTPPPPGASLEVPGVSPLLVPNDRFYRIDTALSVPRVDVAAWSLDISGLVDRPYQLTYADLLDLPMIERYVTLSCVSNEVGGDLVGNAKWQGVPLPALLERAGLRPEATQIVGRAVDGFTVGFPTEVALDGRVAMVAVAMNDEPLPLAHGFPARLVVAGLYGYVSATKWLAAIELTTWEAFDAYWVPRGWAKEAPIKTQSRIDVPRSGQRLQAGPTRIGGVAWAPNRGISRVEVRIDDGNWFDATLADELAADSWRLWVAEWEATTGNHLIRVRATDGAGETQTADVAPPRPDGATGYHTIGIQVI